MDFSFLKFHTSIKDANFDKMRDSERFLNGGVCLHPQEKYLQTTNSSFSIVFNDSYKAELVDCDDNLLLDITDKVFIKEFVDSNGINQITIEIAPLNNDFYYQKIHLKLTHLSSDFLVYSNPFLITADESLSSFRLDYKGFFVYNGTQYDLANYYQSIRVIGHLTNTNGKEDSKIYTEINGQVRKSRVIQSYEESYILDNINTSVYKSLYSALNTDVVYLDGVRCITVDDLSSSDRKGNTNVFEASFKAQFDYNDTYTDIYQIAPPLTHTSLIPLGRYLTVTLPATGVATFNRNINYVSGTLKLYNYSTDALLNSLNITMGINSFSVTMPILADGEYYFLFSDLIVSDLGQNYDITDKEIWKFSISQGDYNNAQYKGTQYFTN